jgi:hypothetical protein
VTARAGTARKSTGAVAKGATRRISVARTGGYPCGFCGGGKPNGQRYCAQCIDEYADFMEVTGIDESPHSADLYKLYRFMSMKDEVERIKEKYS